MCGLGGAPRSPLHVSSAGQGHREFTARAPCQRVGSVHESDALNQPARVAVITGSSSGIGAATALLLSSRGWGVTINYAHDAESAERVAARCRSAGGDALVLEGNVANDADCRALARAARDRWGRIDALVNNAGNTRACRHDDLEGLSAADFQDIYAVNVVGAYQMVRAVAPFMREAGGGSIVNVASVAGILGIGSSVAYAASKGALITMTRSLARALAPQMRVNAVCPGFVAGSWHEKRLGKARYDEFVTRLAGRTPLGAVCTPEDVAEAIVFFLDAARQTTGETLVLDGGRFLGSA